MGRNMTIMLTLTEQEISIIIDALEDRGRDVLRAKLCDKLEELERWTKPPTT